MLNKAMPAALALALGLATATAAYAEYPERDITVVVPFSAGGNTDSIARIVSDQLSKELDATVIIENRGGGGGTVGSAIVAGADADGYTLLFGTAGSHSVNPNLREIQYDPIADFTPVSNAVATSALITVHPDVPAQTIEELIALTSGGEVLNYASGGVGTLAHVAGELYNEKTGSEMIHVPYQGAGQARNDLLAGRVQVFINNIPSFTSAIAAGQVRPLAVAAEKRTALLPDVPTTGEAGLDDFVMGSWYGLLAPAGAPDDVVKKLHAAMVRVGESPEVNERLAAIGLEYAPSESPEAFAAFMKDQLAWWAGVLENPAFKK